MNIKPLFDRVVVKEITPEQKFGKLILQSTSEDRPIFGEVVFVGDGTNDEGKKIPMQVKPGDKVIFSKYVAVNAKIENEAYLLLRQTDILGVITNE